MTSKIIRKKNKSSKLSPINKGTLIKRAGGKKEPAVKSKSVKRKLVVSKKAPKKVVKKVGTKRIRTKTAKKVSPKRIRAKDEKKVSTKRFGTKAAKKVGTKRIRTKTAKKVSPKRIRAKAEKKVSTKRIGTKAAKKVSTKRIGAVSTLTVDKSEMLDTTVLTSDRIGGPFGVQAGDLQGLSGVEIADSESVEELLEEGNAFEAGVLIGVQAADDADLEAVQTHQVPEDDVPSEYLDND